MTIYMNGINGALGSRLFEALLGEGIRGISSTPDATSIYCDLRALKPLDGNFFAQGDLMLFLAAISKPTACAADPDGARRVNVDNTSEFIRRALSRGTRVLFFSSDTVYGQQTGPLRENAPLLGAEPYGMMKKEVEQNFAHAPGFKAFRLSYVVHDDDDFTQYLRSCAKRNVTAEVFEGYARSMIWIGDLLAALKIAVTDWNILPKVLNLGGPECIARGVVCDIYKQTLFPSLSYTTVRAPDGFFSVRPHSIALDVTSFQKIIGNSPCSIKKAVTDAYKHKA